MKFCFKCGAPLQGSEKFCPKCGQKLLQTVTPPPEPQQEETPAHKEPEMTNSGEKKRKCGLHGIIFTDLRYLSDILDSKVRDVRKLLEQYTDFMADADIDYRIVDVSDYVFCSKEAGLRGKKAKLGNNSPWWDYQQILYDIMCNEKEKNLPESNYLFIIGGHEVIPVPVINHYLADDPNFSDKDIETDILYSYPYGPHTQYSLENGELYLQEMYYFVGRLPVPKGVGIGYLTNYLQNACDNRKGLPVKKIYAQTDPHWKGLTSWIMEPYNNAGMLQDRSNISGKYSYGNVMLGPDITSEYIHAVMDVDTDFIYLNLHGSNDPNSPDYAGEYPNHTHNYASIFPVEAMMIPETANIFVAEACYGGRFIGYDVLHSMIQCGLAHKTIIGLASSRIAFGGCEAPGGNADMICGMFTAYLLEGYRAGDAFTLARKGFFENGGMLDPLSACTLAEFNLYGDPSLWAGAVSSEGEKVVGATNRKVAPAGTQCSYKMETLKKSGGERSLLDQVRGAVDANLMEISRSIGKHLYEKYGLPPREPQTIRRLRYPNGEQRLIYTFMNNESSWMATTAPDGTVKSVMVSK